MSRHDVVKRHDFRSAMKSKEKLSSMKSVRFDGIYNGKEAEVGHGGGVSIYIYIYLLYIYIHSTNVMHILIHHGSIVCVYVCTYVCMS